MNKYLIFRTDRIGDFLISAILIKCIKRNEPDSFINVVSSEKNFDYINSFKNVDKVTLLSSGILGKLKLINTLKKEKYHAIIIHDGKQRSMLISLFLNTNLKIVSSSNLSISYFSEIKKILSQLNFAFDNTDLNTLDNRTYEKLLNLENNYILFHFDEKWIHKEYISNYINIEPSEDELISFFNFLTNKCNKKLVVTTGLNSPQILNKIFNVKFNDKIIFFNNLNFLEIESIIAKSDLLISCHGAVSHVAAAMNIRQIDIDDKSKKIFYKKWTDHFRNYSSVYRKNFNDLSEEIISLL